MASSDFDDIFGDLKEDQQFSASLASSGTDLDDDANIFGDAPSAVVNMKPSADKPSGSSSGGGGQDEFLSWLDDGPATTAESTPTPVFATIAAALAMDTINLGENGNDDEDDDFLTTTAPVAAPTPQSLRTYDLDGFDDEPLDSPASSAAMASVVPMPPAIPLHVASSSSSPSPPAAPPCHSTIALDDDDDDLEKIIQQAQANARKAGSRESSDSSLHIKSQSQSSRPGASQFDAVELIKQFNASGTIASPAARIAMWHHSLCRTNESISMYAVQTTPLDLPNQPVLRKDVETMSSAIFSSALHAQSLASGATGGGGSQQHRDAAADGSRLLFIDNAEILVTYLCKKLRLAEYPLGFAFAFGPAIAASGNDPLRVDLIATLQAACLHVMPHLSKQISPRAVAEARRALLKWLLLYHAPAVAFHLDQHFHQWNTDAATIPDAWLASMFESDSYRDGFDFLIQIWDCCALLDVAGSKAAAATKAFPSTTACFIVVSLVARAEKKLLRMEGDQLRHCMAQTLLETLKDPTAEPLLFGLRAMIAATPPSLCIKLRDATELVEQPLAATAASSPSPVDTTASNMMSKSFSLISASASGVMQVGSMVVDMPTKLLTTIVPISFSAASTPGASAKDHAANEEFFTQLMREATPSSSVCLTLAASDVIPQVFRSFQAPQTDETIRYFIIDCRASEETVQGQIPTAFHFDPDAVTEPTVLDTVLATLNPLKTTVHLCVMGQGYGHIADDLRQILATPQGGASAGSSELPFFLKDEFLESFARDISRVNAAVLFLAKRGFPHVSVLEGGYAAAHTQLLHSMSEGFSVADLIDHNAPQCSLCQHRRPSTSSAGSLNARAESQSGNADSRASSPPSRGSSAATLPQMGLKPSGSAPGERDARLLFDTHANPSGGSTYFSSFSGALKNSSKAMGTMAGGSKWLMGMAASNPSSPLPGDSVGGRSPLAVGGIANLNKLRNSFTQLGSESLDMLKKAEHAAKTTQLKGMFGSMSASNVKATSATMGGASSAASTPTGGHSGGGAGGGKNSRSGSFQRAEEEVFTIDDDDEEEQDDFIGGGGRHGSGSSRTSSTSSIAGHRADSFGGASPSEAGAGLPSTVALHTVEKGKIKELTKGMRISRTQMLPFAESPFFSGYKKKQPPPTANPTSPAAAVSGRATMLPRRLVVAENHVLVLKAERNVDDVYCVKSCHHLAHLGRMTCLKKNALMVTLYYKWKAPHSGEIVEKKNAYEVQQRDEFIKVVKTAMEKM